MSLTNEEAIRLMIDGKTLKDKNGNLFKWKRESFYSMFREGNKYYWQVENSMLEMLGGLEIYEPEKDGRIEFPTLNSVHFNFDDIDKEATDSIVGNYRNIAILANKQREMINAINKLKARQG